MPATLLQTRLFIACLFALPLAGQSQANLGPSQSAWDEPAENSVVVSADMLRHPISSRTRGMLHRAIDWMRAGNHEKAIRELQSTLAKDPSSAAYVQSLLGYEFVKTEHVAAAINCFEQAIMLLPHDPANHHNFAVALAVAGDYERAEQEERRAHALAPDNSVIKNLLNTLRSRAEFPGTLNAQKSPN